MYVQQQKSSAGNLDQTKNCLSFLVVMLWERWRRIFGSFHSFFLSSASSAKGTQTDEKKSILFQNIFGGRKKLNKHHHENDLR